MVVPQPAEVSRKGLAGLAVFVVVTVVYACCPIKGLGDLFWSIPTTFSIIKEGNAELDEYREGFHHYPGAVEEVNGHFRNAFPIGSTLVALGPIWLFNGAVDAIAPLTAGLPKLDRGVQTWRKNFVRVGDIDASFFFTTEMVLASLIAALAAVFIQLMGSEVLGWRWALPLTGVFAFCSPVWSTASRDLGQHGPSVLMLSIALWLLVRARRVPASAAWAGLFVALSYLMRPTNSLAVILLTAWVVARHRRQLVGYCTLGAVVAVSFVLYNGSIYGTWLPAYYQPGRVIPASAALFGEAAVGNLFSPGRGLFIYSPVFLLSAYGLWLGLRSNDRKLEVGLVGAIVLLHWLVVSSFPHWWAGYSYGPRYLTDMIPFLTFLLIPVAEKLRSLPSLRLQRALVIAFALTAGWSFFTHLRGATSQKVVDWNATPTDIDAHPERLWSFSDPAFLR